VLSAASADFDRGTKFEQYKSIPEFSEYLPIAQDRPHVARRSKRGDGAWLETVFDSLDAKIRLDAAGVELTMREIYEDISFEVRGL
jgi:Uma2 family endonuclease